MTYPDPLSARRARGYAIPPETQERDWPNGYPAYLFTTLTTIGTPTDVTLQELRIEILFPADAQSERSLEDRTRSSTGSLV